MFTLFFCFTVINYFGSSIWKTSLFPFDQNFLFLLVTSAGNNSRSSDIVRPNFENVRPISHYDRTRWPNMSPAHLEVSSSKVLSVNKLCPVQFVKCPTKRKIWKDICPLNKEKLFPALSYCKASINPLTPRGSPLTSKIVWRYTE